MLALFEFPEITVSLYEWVRHSVQGILPKWTAVGIDVGAEYFLGYFGVETYILQSILQNVFKVQISRFAWKELIFAA